MFAVFSFNRQISVLLIFLYVFIRSTWTTQRRPCPSVTTPSLRHWPVPRCAPHLRRCGVSCDKQSISYWSWPGSDRRPRGHFFWMDWWTWWRLNIRSDGTWTADMYPVMYVYTSMMTFGHHVEYTSIFLQNVSCELLYQLHHLLWILYYELIQLR